MTRIGVVNIDTSHPKGFADYLKKGARARYVAVYNDGFRGDDEVEGFMKSYGLERRCKSVEELADLVDIGFIQGCNWDLHLKHAMPFIERGKTVFIDKPVVGNLADCAKLEALTASGKLILGSSSARYAEEIVAFAEKPESEIGRILNVFGTAGVDEFNYAIHVVEAFGGLLGSMAVSNKFIGSTRIDGKTNECFFLRFSNGATGTCCLTYGLWQPFEIVVTTTKGTFQFRVDSSKIYGALLDRICDFMETGRNGLAPVSAITNSIKAMLAGRLSKEQGGVEVNVSEIPKDDPGFDGAAFANHYSSTTVKIYI